MTYHTDLICRGGGRGGGAGEGLHLGDGGDGHGGHPGLSLSALNSQLVSNWDHFLCSSNLSGSLDDIVLASHSIQIFKFTSTALMFVLSDSIWVPEF